VFTVRCPACALDELTSLADLGEMPVAAGLTFASPQEARQSPRGRMHLGRCPRCRHVANMAFDASLVTFDASFEAALFHSPTYTAYATGVVDRLVKAYDLVGSPVLEIASGSPVLTDRLRDLGCVPYETPSATPPAGSYALTLARFVLEHLADPASLLTRLHGLSARVFVEVPDAGYDLTTAGWDCIYPHVGYFGATSLEALCARTGWRVAEVGTAFHEQYLWAVLERDGVKFDEATRHWRSTLEGRRAVVWGAGTRGTMFCNRVDPSAELIMGVVDRNPAKHSRYLPITGHRVVAPADLASLAPDTVVLTNPAYQAEIEAELASLGVAATVVVA
jgi:C-methyltransferase C-terminal domain/Methyltransferase domain